MGLSGIFGLEFGLFVIARFRKLRGTNDNGWFCGRGGNCGAVGVTSILMFFVVSVLSCRYFRVIFFYLCV